MFLPQEIIRKKRGLLEAANKGTVFLDELGKMPIAQQGKILRAIDDHVEMLAQRMIDISEQEPGMVTQTKDFGNGDNFCCICWDAG